MKPLALTQKKREYEATQIEGLSFLVLVVISLTTYAQKVQRVVIIGLDRFSAPGFKTARHPTIDSLFALGGASLSTRPVMPSVTLPNWTSHLTGSGPEEHGVTAKDWLINKTSAESY